MRTLATFLIVLCLISLVGCATPQYRMQPYSFSSNPPTSYQQAQSICHPHAQMAGSQARAATQERQTAAANQVTGYNCTTQAYSYTPGQATANTSCTPQTAGGYASGTAAMADGINRGLEIRQAEQRAYDNVFRSCMAQNGWGFRQVCVQNCR